MATHFSPIRADGATRSAVFMWGCLAVTCVAALVAAGAAVGTRDPWVRRSTVAGAMFVAGIGTAMYAATCAGAA